VFCYDGGKREMEYQDGHDTEDTSGYEKSGVGLASVGLEDLVSRFLPTGFGVVPVVLGMVN
jgi:hypothetical protein